MSVFRRLPQGDLGIALVTLLRGQYLVGGAVDLPAGVIVVPFGLGLPPVSRPRLLALMSSLVPPHQPGGGPELSALFFHDSVHFPISSMAMVATPSRYDLKLVGSPLSFLPAVVRPRHYTAVVYVDDVVQTPSPLGYIGVPWDAWPVAGGIGRCSPPVR